MEDDRDFEPEPYGRYVPFEEINWNAIRSSLLSLQLFDDPYLSMQALNLGLVDRFITELEHRAMREDDEDPYIGALVFLNALSQMWIFSAYELLRTWRARVKEVLKWHDNGGLDLKIDALRKDNGFVHVGKRIRATQLERVLNNPSSIEQMRDDLRLTHILFSQIEFLRVSLAKHEVSGRAKSVAFSPGYGRLNLSCGALDYQMEAGQVVLGIINRRDIADGIRTFSDRTKIPTEAEIAEFDNFMRQSQED